MRRAVIFVPANIAEGCGREGDAELSRFLQIAMGSTGKLEYYLELAYNLKFFNEETFHQIINNLTKIRKMLNLLIQKVRKGRFPSQLLIANS